jgi:glycosyltransferase involved in cell wall biosynthesis
LPGARDDVAEILAALDVFVLPSLAEGISNTILEAMATGLPIVATNVGGNAELIEAGRTGELVQAGDDDALAKALLAYASDQERARAAGRAGRARAERLYGVDTMVARYAALYWRLMAMRKGSVIATPASAEAGPTTEIH